VARDASEEDIKRAYRAAALVHHPDKARDKDSGGGGGGGGGEETFKQLAVAYAVLSDARKRRYYDATGANASTCTPQWAFLLLLAPSDPLECGYQVRRSLWT
jgi:DnaJ-class molecular chaperone